MKKIKQYGITMPIEMHERLNKMKKDTWIITKRLLENAVNEYVFHKNDKDKDFDSKLFKKSNVDIDIEKYKQLNNIKLDNWVSIWFLILCAVDKYIK